MASVDTGDSGGGHGGKHQKKRAKKMSTHIDMTPMVDLAFLLVTFFVLTSTFNKPKTMEINMPKKDTTNRTLVNNAITFLISNDDNIYWYYGEFYPEGNAKGKPATQLQKTNYSKDGVRKLLTDKNYNTIKEIKVLEERFKKGEIKEDSTLKKESNKVKGKKEALMALIKTDDKAEYGRVIEVLDEFSICDVGKYAVVDMDPIEKKTLDFFMSRNKK